MPANPTVVVVGLGYVGSCLAATLADRGLRVTAVDTDSRLIEEMGRHHCRFREEQLAEVLFRTMSAGALTVTTDYQAVTEADVVVVTVGTPVTSDGVLADDQLRSACSALGKRLRAGQLVIFKSTVPPGATRDLVLPLLEGSGLTAGVDFHLSFTPERLAEGTALNELRTFGVVVGGLTATCAEVSAAFWRSALGVEVFVQDSLEAAELVKLADNWWIDLNIALANELAKLCAPYGVDVLDVIDAANMIPKGKGKVNILLPSVGVGGSCLTKDPWMVWHAARGHGIQIRTALAGREVNAGMPGYAARVIMDELAKLGKDLAGAKVAVLGLAYKNNTGDLRATPTQPAIAALTGAGAHVSAHDPLVDAAQAEELFGFKPAPTVHEAVDGADCIAVLALHREFEDLDFSSLPVSHPCLVFDGRAYYPKEKICALRELGFAYRGIGR